MPARPSLTAIAVSLLLSPTLAALPLYSVTPIPSAIGPGDYIIVHALNDQGQVVGGHYVGATAAMTPFLWSASSGVQYLPPSAGGAHDINSAGQVVGPTFLWTSSTGSTPLPLGPMAINNAGTVAGEGGTWTQATGVTPLLAPPGEPNTFGADINSSGQIVGHAFQDNVVSNAYLWPSPTSAPQPLGQLVGTPVGSLANAINDNGWITGFSNTRAFLWRPGLGMMEIPSVFPEAGNLSGLAINNSNTIVGHAEINAAEDPRAFYYTLEEGMHDLNTLLDSSGEGWVLEAAYDINDSGQIVGTGSFNGMDLGFLLTPIPEPATFTIFALSSLFLLRRCS